MVSVAAGLAQAGLKPWVYSIAPYVYARAFEQIRNDVCLHNLPVFLVGNGGGYAYGVMGPTHHAIEDYGTLLGLPHLSVYVPAFRDDESKAASRITAAAKPAYLRLGRDEKPQGFALPEKGATTIILCILFFGSLNLLGIAIVGEYIAKILEETKRRPHFIRKTIIRRGEARSAEDADGS
jgi:hypothetical protein